MANVLIRQTSKSNPLGVRIGERVLVSAWVDFGYVEKELKNDERAWRSKRTISVRECTVTEFDTKQWLYVIGTRRKAVGEYIPGGTIQGIDGAEYEPPSFRADKYYLVYECRADISSPVILALPEHVEPFIK